MTTAEFLAFLDKMFHYQLFELNQTPVTLLTLSLFFILLLSLLLFSRFIQRTILKKTFAYLNLDPGTSYTFSRIIHYLILVIGLTIAFQFVGIDFSGLAVIFGFLSVGIGFGLQNITSNFIAGLILLVERPIQVGDRVTVNDINGDVQEINIRSTTIRSERNISIIVPNSDFVSSSVLNWSHYDQRVRMEIDVGVSYNSDLQTVLRCLKEVAIENKEVLTSPEPEALLLSFGDSSWNLQLRAWIPNPKRYRNVLSDLNCAIVESFRKNGVEIPFPQRDLHIRSSLPIPVVDAPAKAS